MVTNTGDRVVVTDRVTSGAPNTQMFFVDYSANDLVLKTCYQRPLRTLGTSIFFVGPKLLFSMSMTTETIKSRALFGRLRIFAVYTALNE